MNWDILRHLSCWVERYSVFAFGCPVPAVDGNVLRILSRLRMDGDFINLQSVKKRVEEELTEVVHIDMALPFSYVTETLVGELELLEPFGKGNTKPVFAARNVQILGLRVLGKNQNVLRMKLRDESGVTLEGIYFQNQMQAVLADLQKKPVVHMLYYPEINEFRGQKSLQLRMANYC